MISVIDAYDLPVGKLADFYQRLNSVITYPDGMTTTLGIVYWGRGEHMVEIERAVPLLMGYGIIKFSNIQEALRTSAGVRKVGDQTGISHQILHILKHDIGLWLPLAIPLAQLEWFNEHPACLKAYSDIGLQDQLSVISNGITNAQRENLVDQTRQKRAVVEDSVKFCDYYRTGKNLKHIRARIYFEIGLDTWQKWAGQTSGAVIEMFNMYLQANLRQGERLIPWPKEVRNGIEWAKMHLEVFAVEW